MQNKINFNKTQKWLKHNKITKTFTEIKIKIGKYEQNLIQNNNISMQKLHWICWWLDKCKQMSGTDHNENIINKIILII